MKRIIQIVASIVLLTSNTSNAQTIPSQGNGNATSDFWSRSGNLPTTGANIFGTRWNSPIYTITGGISTSNVRMKVNGDFLFNTQYPIDNYNWGQQVNTSGYIGIGINNSSISNGQLFHNQKGAFSLLHINGPGSGFQEFGYRPWMQTGVTFTGNRDLSYFGLRKVGTGEDITETTITWSDNNAGNTGPDDMVFRFTGAGNGNTSISTNLTNNGDLDGLHIARFAPTGEFGLGNTFGVNAPGTPAGLYVRPASLAHYSLSNYRSILDTEKTE